jgi:hypothetical protein
MVSESRHGGWPGNRQTRQTEVEDAMQSLESREATRRAHLCPHPDAVVRYNKSFKTIINVVLDLQVVVMMVLEVVVVYR